MPDIDSTRYFEKVEEQKLTVPEVLQLVYDALTEKGYNPVNQIVGYVMSGLKVHRSKEPIFEKLRKFLS